MKKRNNILPAVNFQKLPFLSYFILPLVFLDQAVKMLAGNPMQICNRQGVFGLATGGMPVFLGVLLFVLYSIYMEKRKYVLIGLSFIFAGGFSNILDRLFFGCVRDFIGISNFPTFNLADVFITMGVLFVVFGVAKNKYD